MSGRHNFRELQTTIKADPERRARLEGERRLTETVIQLTALREARGATQQQIADAWDVTQANISQIEHTPDIFLSTLSKYVEALGGRLEITAVFPDQAICLLPSGASSRQESDPPSSARAG